MSVYEVVMDGGKPWGIRMQGGMGSTFPLRIAQITPGSKAAIKGLSVGIEILEINGFDTSGLTMIESQDLIKKTGDKLSLRVLNHSQPLHSQEMKHVVMEGGKPWGIRLQGGKDTGKQLKIGQVTPGSKAAEARLIAGDEIFSINDISTEQLSMIEAQNLIKETGETLKLSIGNIPHTSQLTINPGVPVSTPETEEQAFFDDIMNHMAGGEEKWGVHEAKGNTFNMLKDHMDAGQGRKVLTVFDVAPSERNKSIPTMAPKVQKRKEHGDPSEEDSIQDREIVMHGGSPWGIRVKGGKNSGSVLSIANVVPGSKAYNNGLLVGDQVKSINNINTQDLTMLQAQNVIKETGDELKLLVKSASVKRLEEGIDEEFFNDLKISMKGGRQDRSGRDVKGNAFKILQNVVDSHEDEKTS